MKIGNMMITAGVLALGLAMWTPSKAQGPMYDRVNVNLPYSVTIGERTLPPGDYVIQQLRDQGGGSRVLLIYSDKGMKFETSAMTIPALDNRTPENTSVILHHFGNDYYFDKVWITGKDYGYEFPLPDAVKSRERERSQPISVAANYSTVQSTDTTTTTTTNTAANSAATSAQTTTPATSAQTTTSAATNGQTATSAATSGQTTLGQHAEANQSTTQSAATTQRTTTAQSTMPPATTQSQSTMQPSTTSGRSTMSAADRSATTAADRGATSGSADRSMPNTAAGWVMMLLSGGTLSGAGLALRRRR
jgi:hypothetical protein